MARERNVGVPKEECSVNASVLSPQGVEEDNTGASSKMRRQSPFQYIQRILYQRTKLKSCKKTQKKSFFVYVRDVRGRGGALPYFQYS